MPAPRRLVIDGRRLGAGRTGVGRYLECLLAEWAHSGLPAEEVRVILSDRAGLDAVPAAEGLVADVVGAGLPGLLWERFALGRVLGPGDVLFAPTNLVPASWRGPTVLVMFDALQEVRPTDFPRLVRLRFGRRYRRAVRSADRVIVPSQATADDLERIYGTERERLVVIHPAPDPGFRPLPADDPAVLAAREAIGLPAIGSRRFFLFAGKRSRRRHVPEILGAFARLSAELPDMHLVFVGDGSGRGLDPIPGVIDAGHVADATLRGLMAAATALLYPSEHEGFGLPVVEAMAAGCPVVTLRRPALVEAGGEGPVYLADADVASLAEAMHRLATDATFREERVAAGLHEAGRFSASRFAAEVAREIGRVRP